ncbi:unnamed protein product, partial [Discosporangium mesarthrocarpum]
MEGQSEAGGGYPQPPLTSLLVGNGGVMPSAEQLEAEALRRGKQPLVMCLRRCPHCLEGVPIRSRMCSYCHFMIPPSAKAAARKEAQDAANQGGNGSATQQTVSPDPTGTGAIGSNNRAGGMGGAGGGGEEEVAEAPRRRRKRQVSKKGLMTATEEEMAELDEGLEEDEPVSWRKSIGQRGRSGRVTIDKRKKKCPSCNEMNPMSVKMCRECDAVFPVGSKLDSAVTSEELREKFSFEPEYNKDGTPMIEKIHGRRIVEEGQEKGKVSVLKKLHRAPHFGHSYEFLVKFRGVSYAKVEWMTEGEIRGLGMVASRMLTNYLKHREREERDDNDLEDDEYFDPSYLV